MAGYRIQGTITVTPYASNGLTAEEMGDLYVAEAERLFPGASIVRKPAAAHPERVGVHHRDYQVEDAIHDAVRRALIERGHLDRAVLSGREL